MKDEALKLALDALESGVDTQIGLVAWIEYDSCLISDVITAIREAQTQPAQKSLKEMTEADFDAAHDIGQPAQKPVAWMEMVVANLVREGVNKHKARDLAQHFYNPPQRPWVGLTAEEAAECWTTSATQTWKNFEAKLKEKNT